MKYLSTFFAVATIICFMASVASFIWLPFNAAIINGTWALTGVLFVAWAILNKKFFIQFFNKRSTLYQANLALVLFLVVGILVFINILGNEYRWRKDYTRTGAQTLSAQTIKILKSLNQPVHAYFFGQLSDRERLDDLFKRYKYETPKFNFQFVETSKQPALTASMGVKKNDTLVLTLDGSLKKISIEGATEESITNGLIKLVKQNDKVIYFLTGHSEKPIQGSETEPGSAVALRQEMEKQGYVAKELNFLSDGKMPADASLLIVLNPMSGFFPNELQLLKDWLKGGGNAIFAFDLDIQGGSLFKGGQQSAALLQEFGVQLHNNILVDPMSTAAKVQPQIILGFVADETHPIVRDFPSSKTALVANFLFPLTGYLTAKPSEGIDIVPIVKTSPQAWSIEDWRNGKIQPVPSRDKQATRDLAYAVNYKSSQGKTGRWVIFANARFLANEMFDKAVNKDLVLNAISWSVGDNDLLSIRPKTDDKEVISLDGITKLQGIVLVITFLVPLLALACGFYVWWRRAKL